MFLIRSLAFQIIGLFILNILLLAGVILFAARSQLSEELDSVIGKEISRKLWEINASIQQEMDDVPLEQWNTLLDISGRKYGLSFLLFNVRGDQLAGVSSQLPVDVFEKFHLNRPDPFRPPPRGPGPQGRNGREPARVDDLPEEDRNFFALSNNPKGYWFATRMRVQNTNTGFTEPGMLLAHSPTLLGLSGLVHWRPWMWFGGAVFALSAALWAPFLTRLSRSIGRITSASESIASGKFETRIADNRQDELGRLSHSINQLSERLEGFVNGQKRFLGDTAHELCAPIARMQMATGILQERSPAETQRYVKGVDEELQEMSKLVGELLSFAKADFQRPGISWEPVQVGELIKRAWQKEASPELKLDLQIAEHIRVMSDPGLLDRAVTNILRNAVRYVGSHLEMQIRSQVQDGEVEITFQDNGPGVPESDLPSLFDPFFRVETSRNRDDGGAGLGLALVRESVECCGGSVWAANATPEPGPRRGFIIGIRLKTGSS